MECAGCGRRFGAAAAEHMAACPICAAPWTGNGSVPERPEPVLSRASARPVASDPVGRWEPAPVPVSLQPVPATPPPLEAGSPAPPPPRPVASRPFFVAPQASRGSQYYDLVFVENKAALVPTNGGQEWVGWLLLGWIGYLIARFRTQRQIGPRLARLRPVADEVVASIRPKDVFPYADITRATLFQGLSVSTLRLRLRGRRNVVIKWNNSFLRDTDLAGSLRAILGPAVEVRNRKRRRLILLGLLVSPIALSIPFAFLAGDEPLTDAPPVEAPALAHPAATPTGDRPGTAEAMAACIDLGTFLHSLGERAPLAVEFEVAMNKFGPRMDVAAAKDPHWAPAVAAAREMARLMQLPQTDSVRAEVAAQGAVIDGICGPVAWSD